MKITSRNPYLACEETFSAGKKLLIWVNIFLQLVFPVAVSITPAMAASEKNSISQMSTQPYELKKGETTAAVAARYHLTLEALARLNQFRSFAQPFASLGEGAEIDVPVVDKSSEPQAAAAQDTRLAQTASQFGQLMSGDNRAQSAADMASGMVNSKVSQTVSDWLSQFGTAKVQLNTNNKFAFADSQLDVLFPLYDRASDVFFTQGGIRDTDGRTIANLGIGDRFFTDGTMMGANLFIDRDISGRHTRAGTGGEYWRDYLKLAANGYFAVSDWKQSHDLNDYDERPANGFDLRSDMYLPAYPQLGAKLIYEQYYGHNVGLFGKDNLQRNPSAVTAGLTYTPVPLLSFDLGERQGEQHKHDTQVSMNLTYNFAQGFAEQLDPSMVALKRSLAGNRYDLVDRNNDIVFEYRKQELVHLTVLHDVSGLSGEKKPLHVSVSSKYGIEKIDYQASAGFDAAGGKVTWQAGDYVVTLPAWNEHNNHYTLTFVATDKKGNTSKPQVSNITVLASPVSGDSSSLTSTLTDNAVVADGQATADIVIKLTDSNGYPATVAPESIVLTSHFAASAASDEAHKLSRHRSAAVKATPGPTLGPVSAKDGEPGTYISVLTAGYAAGVATISAKVEEVSLKNTLTVTQTPVDINTSADSAHFTTDKTTLTADNKDLATLTFSINDSAGNPVKHLASAPAQLAFSLSTKDGVTLSDVQETGGGGVYKAVLRGTKSQVVSVTPVVRGTPLTDNRVDITLVADNSTVSLNNDSVTVTQDNQKADGTAADELTVVVTDKFGNPVSGIELMFSAGNGAVVTAGASDANGLITARVTSTTAGDSSVKVALPDGQSITRVLHFSADTTTAVLAPDSFTVLGNNAPADGVSQNKVKVQVKDAFDNPVKGMDVFFTASPDITLPGAAVKTGDDGYAEIAFSSAVHGGTVTVTASLKNGTNDESLSVLFNGNPQTASTSSDAIIITQNNAAANGIDKDQVQVKVEDANSNVIAGVPVEFSSNDSISFEHTTVKTSAQGIATVNASSLKSGDLTFTVTVNGAEHVSQMTFEGDITTSKINAFDVSDNGPFTVSDSTGYLLTATVVDDNGNPVKGDVVTFKTADDTHKVTFSDSNVRTGADGTATTRISSTLAGTLNVVALVRNDVVTGKSLKVTFVSDSTSAALTMKTVDDGAIANGVAENTVGVSVKDKFDNPIAQQDITFTLDDPLATLSGAQVVQTDEQGVATARVHSTNAGTVTVTATGAGATNTQKIRFIADAGTAVLLQDNVSVSPSSAAADDATPVKIKATVTDKNSNPVPGHKVEYAIVSPASGATFDNGNREISVDSDQNGEAVAAVKATVAADYTVKVTVENNAPEVSSHDVVVSFTPDFASAKVSSVRSEETALADGKDVAVIAEVQDKNGNKVDNATVTFSVTPASATFSNGKNTADENTTNGTARVELKSTQSGDVTISAVVKDAPGTPEKTTVKFIASKATATLAESDFTVSPDSIAANGTATSTLTALVKDASGNLVEGQDVTFAIASGTGATLSAKSQPTNAQGKAVVTMTSGKTANKVTVTASANGANVSRTITLVGDAATAKFKSLTTSVTVLPADNKTISTITASVFDVNGNPVTGMPVTFKVKKGTATLSVASGIVNTDAAGKAEINLASATPGDVTVSASLSQSGSTQTEDSDVVTFVKPYIKNPLITTSKNTQSFAADSGFPQTGFDTAMFSISPTGDAGDNSLFKWTSSEPDSASVVQGVVTLRNKPAKEVTITAVYRTGEKYEYKFTIKKWFTHGDKIGNDVISGTMAQVKSMCESNGMKLPTNSDYSELTNKRSVGRVYGEWGNLEEWGWTNDNSASTSSEKWYRTADTSESGVYLNNGDTSAKSGTTSIYPAACMK